MWGAMENTLGNTLGTWEHIENLIGPIENSTGTPVKFFDFSGKFENQWFSDSDFYLKKLELMVFFREPKSSVI